MASDLIVDTAKTLELCVDRGFIQVVGTDAGSFLQGQLSQDIDNLSIGDAKWSFLLSSQGKSVALMQVWKRGDKEFSLVVEPKVVSRVVERLESFKFRVDVSISSNVHAVVAHRSTSDLVAEGWRVEWPKLNAIDVELENLVSKHEHEEIYETLRINSGVPSNSYELAEEVIPQETEFVDKSVDFKKGCYVGQELVSRINARGRVRQRLVRFVVPPEKKVVVGDKLIVDDADVGRVTSVAPLATQEGRPILAYLRSEIEDGSAISINSVMTTVESTGVLN